MEIFQQYLQRGLFEENMLIVNVFVNFIPSVDWNAIGWRHGFWYGDFLLIQAPCYIRVDYFLLTLNMI